MKKLRSPIEFLRILSGAGDFKLVWQGGVIVLFAVCALGVFVDLRNTTKFGQIDLRNRVVGARAMLMGHNPYTYRWQTSDPTTLLDPSIDHGSSLSKATVSPTVLSLHAVNASLPYRYQKFVWLAAQFGLLVGIAGLAISRSSDPATKAAILMAAALFSSTMVWRLHVERGQIYVLFSFLAVLLVRGLKDVGPRREVFAGVVLGILVCLRPHFAVLGVPALLYRRQNVILGAFSGLFLGLLIPALIFPAAWSDYFRAMLAYAHVTSPVLAAGAPLGMPVEFPTVVEGALNMGTYANFWDKSTSLRSTLALLGMRPPVSLYAGLLLAGAVAWIFYVFRLRRAGVPLDFCTAKTLALVLFIEIAVPIARQAYSDVILLTIIVTILSSGAKIGLVRPWEWALILTAWCFSSPFPPWVGVAYRLPVMSVIPPYAILVWAVFAPFRASRSNSSAFE